jgi:hypothetical protein
MEARAAQASDATRHALTSLTSVGSKQAAKHGNGNYWVLTKLDHHSSSKKKCKAIPVTGRGGPIGCEMLRIPHCLDNRLTDGGKVVSLTRRPCPTPQKHYFSASDAHFC